MKLAIASVNAELNALASLHDGGSIQFFTGEQPKSPEQLPAGTLLGTLALGSPAFKKANGGSITANPITGDDLATATGTAGWFRVWKSNGLTPIWDGVCGRQGWNADCILNTVEIQVGAPIEVTLLKISLPA